MAVKGVEALRPERPQGVDPFANLINAVTAQRVQLALSVATSFDEPGFAKHPKVSRHSGPRDVELQREIAGASLAVAEQLKNPAASGIRDRLKSVHIRM